MAFAVFDLSVDFPREVNDDNVNLDLDTERSRLEDAAPGGGGKLGGGSLRFLWENGEITVIALAGLAYSAARLTGGVDKFDVCKVGGVRIGGLEMVGGLRIGVLEEAKF